MCIWFKCFSTHLKISWIQGLMTLQSQKRWKGMFHVYWSNDFGNQVTIWYDRENPLLQVNLPLSPIWIQAWKIFLKVVRAISPTLFSLSWLAKVTDRLLTVSNSVSTPISFFHRFASSHNIISFAVHFKRSLPEICNGTTSGLSSEKCVSNLSRHQ